MGVTSLGTSELARVLDFADRSLGVHDFEQVPGDLLDGVLGLVGAETGKLLHLDLRTGDEAVLFAAMSQPPLDQLRAYAEVGLTHPVARVLGAQVARDPRRSTLIRLSDVVEARRWRSSALHSATGLADQLWLPLSVRGGVVQVVTVGRYGRPFSDRQREVLLACRAHLGAALGRAARGPQHRLLQIRPQLTWVSALDAPGSGSSGAKGSGLSAREREVLSLVAAGRTDAQVARTLGLTTATVSKHLQRVYRRLDLPNRVAAVRYYEAETRELSRPGSSAGVTKR